MTNLILIIILAFALMLIGLLGVVLPLLPGTPLAWLGFFIYAWYTGFEEISITLILVFLGLVFLSIIMDFVAPLIGAKTYRASKFGILGVFVGGFVGAITFGPIGIIFGPILGAFLGELYSKKNFGQALKSALGAFAGIVLGALLKAILILVMMGYLIFSLF